MVSTALRKLKRRKLLKGGHLDHDYKTGKNRGILCFQVFSVLYRMFANVCWVWYNIYKEMNTDMARKIEATVPVMANQRPWNELVLQGRRKYKTLNFNWKHRGPILLYNSLAVDYEGCIEYDFPAPDAKKLPTKTIVGFVTVTDVFDDGYRYEVFLSNPKRFKRPIPFNKPAGAVRVFRAPAKFLKRATV